MLWSIIKIAVFIALVAAASFAAIYLLELDGEDLTGLPNIERKERLEALLDSADPPIHVAEHVFGAGEHLYRAMCDAGQEGIISKTVDGKYAGRRSKAWVKVKCTRRQEFVIIGWKKSSAKGRPFASLLVAQHEGDDLVYKGNVGTGFSADDLDELAGKMKRLARKTSWAREGDEQKARDKNWRPPPGRDRVLSALVHDAGRRPYRVGPSLFRRALFDASAQSF